MPDSQLAQIMGTDRTEVNSLHHQAIRDVAQGFAQTATAPDGIVEAIEDNSRAFAVAVQWHPEDMGDEAAMRHLFETFVDAARQRMRRTYVQAEPS